jgi:hypothetical protein
MKIRADGHQLRIKTTMKVHWKDSLTSHSDRCAGRNCTSSASLYRILSQVRCAKSVQTQTVSEMTEAIFAVTETGRRLGAASLDVRAGMYSAHISFWKSFVGMITAINVYFEQ